jgi:hypothetical protein
VRLPAVLGRFLLRLLRRTVLGIIGTALAAALLVVLDAVLLRDRRQPPDARPLG